MQPGHIVGKLTVHLQKQQPMDIKKLLISSLIFAAFSAHAKHPQCAGNPDIEKCEKLWDDIKNETPDKKSERIQRVEKSRDENMTASIATPTRLEKAAPPGSNTGTGNPKIGMSSTAASDTYWGRPEKINKTTTAEAVREQWVYHSPPRYLYFVNGVLTAIQE